jgi:hypothetical protein
MVEKVVNNPALVIRCPHCDSTQIVAKKKGYNCGIGLFGAIVTGNIFGLLWGMINSDGIELICVSCGFSWTPTY